MNSMLKKVTILILALFSAMVMAQSTPVGGIGNDGGGPKQSWQDIYKNPNLNPTFPKFDIQGRMVSYRFLCLMGERVRTKYKHVINPTTDYSKIIFDYLVTERVREVDVCRQYRENVCTEWGVEVIEIPLKEKIKVYKRVEDPNTSRTSWELAFEKNFELQECRD